MKKLVAYGNICAVLACVGYGELFLDGDSLGIGIDLDAHARSLGAGADEAGAGDLEEADLVQRVRRVAHELTQEDLAVRVDGMDHQVQELLDLGLEAMLDSTHRGLRSGVRDAPVGTGDGAARVRATRRGSLCVGTDFVRQPP